MTDVRIRREPARQPSPLQADAIDAAIRPLLLAVEVVLFVALVVIAASAYGPVFSSWRTYVGPVHGSIAVSTVLAVVLRRWSVPTRFAVLASLVGLTLYLSYTVLVDALTAGVVPGPDTLEALRAGVGNGWHDILDGALPVVDSTAPLVWVCSVAWIAAHLTTDLVQRTRLVAVPLVPPLALLALALPLVTAAGQPSSWLVAVFIVLALTGVLVRAAPASRRVRRGDDRIGLSELHSRSVLSARLRHGLPIAVVLALVAPLVGGLVTTRDPVDPRDLRDQVTLPASVSDPLGQLKAQIDTSPPRPAFRVTFDAPVQATEVKRVAVLHLDHYDGVRWTSTGRFVDAPTPLLDGADAGPGRDVTQRYTIAATDDPWIPTAGIPLRLNLPDVAYDPDSGDLLTEGTVSGLRYDVVSRVNDPGRDQIATATVSHDTDLDRYLQLGGNVPDAIRAEAVDAVAGAATDGETLLRIEDHLRTGFAYDADAVAGHSYGRLTRFLTEDRRGTAEQFAASFAVLARSLGYPAQVVVGYKVAVERDESLVPLEFVTSEQYHAWAEVHFDGLGWVAFDPTPRAGDTPLPTDEPEQTPPTTVPPEQPPEGQRTPEETGPSEGLPEAEQHPDAVGRRLVTGVAAGAGAILLLAGLVAAAIVIAKARRRRRRRSGSAAADRVVGAWDETVDRLVEMRFPIREAMTPRDIARLSHATYGAAAAEPLRLLVPAVSSAVFARDEPTADAATAAWQHAEAFEQNLASTLTRRQRLRARLSLRPFRR